MGRGAGKLLFDVFQDRQLVDEVGLFYFPRWAVTPSQVHNAHDQDASKQNRLFHGNWKTRSFTDSQSGCHLHSPFSGSVTVEYAHL